MRDAWVRCTKAHRCPICGKPDWCCLSADGAVANCMRVEGPKRARNGGWIHRLTDRHDPIRRTPAPTPPLRNAAALLARWARSTAPGDVAAFAGDLGVSSDALTSLGAVYAAPREAWAFPMRDGTGKAVGIRLRASTGRKWSVTGSREGLFYPEDFAPGTALVCEGPTDCAAALTLGFNAVGRPSCLGGLAHIRALFERCAIRRAIILADDDAPGRRGALRLAGELAITVKLLAVPAKDLRDFLRAGANAAIVREMLKQQEWK